MNPDTAPQHPILDYDLQARVHYWYPEAFFGLVYEYLHPGDRLLDAGIGTGLASQTFAKAGVQVYGFDGDPEMLAVCRAKAFAADLKEHDLQDVPWPYDAGTFQHILTCGVLHFLADLGPVFAEVNRLLSPNGTFTFTAKAAAALSTDGTAQEKPAVETIQGVKLYLHSRESLDRMMATSGFGLLKEIRLVVRTGHDSDDLFYGFVTRRKHMNGMDRSTVTLR